MNQFFIISTIILEWFVDEEVAATAMKDPKYLIEETRVEVLPNNRGQVEQTPL